MAIVFLPVIKPSSFTGGDLVNGKLPACDLESLWMPGVGHLSLHKYTAKAFRYMQAICHAETGLHLSATGAYRSYDQQVNVFLQRYTTTYSEQANVLTSSRTWNGVKYYLRRGMAPVAVPGTSNHGLGIAVDTGWWSGTDKPGLSDILGVTSQGQGWQWIQDNAESFGFSWEGAKPGQPGWEPWHLRHVLGNTNSQRVKDIDKFFGVA